MVEHKCHKCDRIFKQKGHLEDHLNKKNACDSLCKKENTQIKSFIFREPIKVNAEIMKKKLDECKCAYCDKQFTRKNNVIQHIKNNCKVIKQMNNEKDKILNRLIEENQKLKEENEKYQKNQQIIIKK
jgi:hypothetical protein